MIGNYNHPCQYSLWALWLRRRQQYQPAQYPGSAPTPVYQYQPSCPAISDISDLRHQFLSTQFTGKSGQVIFLLPMSAGGSVQTIRVPSPLAAGPGQPPGQFSVQTIVLAIMKVDNTNQLHLQQINNNNNCLPQPTPPPPSPPAPSSNKNQQQQHHQSTIALSV